MFCLFFLKKKLYFTYGLTQDLNSNKKMKKLFSLKTQSKKQFSFLSHQPKSIIYVKSKNKKLYKISQSFYTLKL